MFGYVAADFRRLSKSAKKDYKAAYCGLCRSLSKRYGIKARFLLSFDTTFLLKMLSLADGESDHVCCACPMHFGARRDCRQGKNCDYAADVTMLLCCMKFEDDIKDNRSLIAMLLKLIYKNSFEKAKRNRPELFNGLLRCITELDRAERRNERDPNVPADIFGQLMSQVFSENESLSEFGYYLGRFIYLADAVCDFKKDLKRKRYNVLASHRTSEFEDMLTFNADKCIEELDSLGIRDEITDNVLHYGIWLRYTLKYKRTV